jgi:hypothetical protein
MRTPEWMRQPGSPPWTGEQLPEVVETAPKSTHPLKIEAIACVCGGASTAREALTMLETLRRYHPEWPVFLLADEAGAEVLRQGDWERPGDVLHLVSAELIETLAAAASQAARPHGDQWPIGWISAKILCLELAIRHYRRPVMLVDADLIFTRRLPDLVWDADLVLSEHAGPIPDRLSSRSGIYNAGMVLTRSLRLCARWREFFEAGVGGFYEQGCLEDLSREYLTDTFPAAWNWGDWRRTEDLIQSGRSPAVLHVHLDHARVIDNRATAHESIVVRARHTLAELAASADAPKKIAVIHYAKAAGSSLCEMLRRAGERGGWQCLNSHQAPYSLRRDWTEVELDLIESGSLPLQRGERWIVHNHAQHWTAERVERWTAQGWVFVAVLRPIRDRLTSFYHWNQTRDIIDGPAGEAETLEEFLKIFLAEPRYSDEFAVHAANDCIQHWGTADDEGLRALVHRVTGLETPAIAINASRNQGWQAALAAGLISKKTRALIDKDGRIKAWDRLSKQLQ